MFELFRTLSLRYMTRHYVRAGLVICSIALGVAAWVASETVYGALTDSVHNAASPLRGSADFSVTNTATLVVEAELADVLRRVPGIDRVEPIILETVKADA